MELAQYLRARVADTPPLISKFVKRLQQPSINKIFYHYFSNLVDWYSSTQLAEANIKVRNAKRARACKSAQW